MVQVRREESFLLVFGLILLVAVFLWLPASGESNVTHFKGVDVEDVFRTSPQDSNTVTQDEVIAPTGAYQPITAAASLGTGSITAGTAGDMLLLINTGSYTVTITDTGTLMLSGNAVLGQYDSLLLWCDGTNWIEVGQANN